MTSTFGMYRGYYGFSYCGEGFVCRGRSWM